ncbi:hypothetical protein K438DRAFT_1958309 [Mycena galopus ATCC 62051]|nr:hypothetical protein K438DRAFT_1958309 [Mycena galopus ATCC 62051]
MVSSFIRLALVANIALAVSGLVIPRVAPGTQFITGPCTSDADCASTCCGAKTGVCNALAVANGPGGGGCGGAAGAAVAATSVAAAAAPAGTQFISGACTVDADCASTCCGAKTGVCNAFAVANEAGGGGCGGPAAVSAAAAPAATALPAAAAVSSAAAPAGTQFITGACTVDADCASTCCGAKTGVCNALAVANGPGGGGCGGKAAASTAAAAPAVAAPPAASTAAAAAAPAGTQFISGACTVDADCASTCCGAKTGVCNAPAVANEAGGGGCGGPAAARRSFLF